MAENIGAYIGSIEVINSYADRDFTINLQTDAEKDKSFLNLILTGKNGCGKTTILKAIHKWIVCVNSGIPIDDAQSIELINRAWGQDWPFVQLKFEKNTAVPHPMRLVIFISTTRLGTFEAVEEQKSFYTPETRQGVLSSDALSDRAFNLLQGTVSETSRFQPQDFPDLIAKIQGADLDNSKSPVFLDFLTEMKRRQAYAIADADELGTKRYSLFFQKLEKLFQQLFEDQNLRLKHKFSERKFYFEFGSGLQVQFNHLADGFKSILIIVAEIEIQTEIFLLQNNLEKSPGGIVLIDELEAHLHLSLQEKILPALTSFFPHYQFIVATHSPQVCASDQNSILYDLTTHHRESEFVGGISYDVLSKTHFGLKSEYSLAVTQILERAKSLLQQKTHSQQEMAELQALEKELTETSPELAYELSLFLSKSTELE